MRPSDEPVDAAKVIGVKIWKVDRRHNSRLVRRIAAAAAATAAATAAAATAAVNAVDHYRLLAVDICTTQYRILSPKIVKSWNLNKCAYYRL